MMSIKYLPEWLHEPLIQAYSNARVWLVGGAIRNALLGLETIDFDFAVDGNARSLARSIADSFDGYYYELDRDRDTGRVILIQDNQKRLVLDFARMRGAQIQNDLEDRDFTINALAVDISRPAKILDATGGLQDLKDKILRLCKPDSIIADPVRALRAVRLSVQLDLSIDPIALNAIRSNTRQLSKVASERIRDELFRLLALPLPGKAIRLMDHLDLNSELFPELDSLRDLMQPLPHELAGWDHTLAVMDHLGRLLIGLSREYDPETASELIMGEIVYRLGRFRNQLNQHLDQELSFGRKIRQLLFFGALYHDAGKPACYKVEEGQIHFYGHEGIGAELVAEKARNLRMSSAEVRWLQNLVRNHLRPLQLERERTISHRAIFRFLRDTNQCGVEVVLLSLADLLGQKIPPMDQERLYTRVDTGRQLLEANFEAARKYDPTPLLKGNEIAEELDLKPGPVIGQLLEELLEAQVTGDVTSKDEAYEFIRSMHQGGLELEDF